MKEGSELLNYLDKKRNLFKETYIYNYLFNKYTYKFLQTNKRLCVVLIFYKDFYLRFNDYLSSFDKNEISEYCLNFKSDILKSETQKSNTVCVALYTCEKYLNNRVKSCFSTWFKKLDNEKYIFTGSQDSPKKIDSELNNYLVKLKVNDDYEYLPQKTLALIEWFLKNSTSEYLFKVDDCYVNIDVFENLISNLNGDYVGKIIQTSLDSDRYWHVDKSNSVYAQNTPDLSPDVTKQTAA